MKRLIILIVTISLFFAYYFLYLSRRARAPTPLPSANKNGIRVLDNDNIIYHKESGKIYISIMGEVFDVSDGSNYYGEGGGYHFFAGKDASRAFVSGVFSGPAIDEVLDLPSNQIAAIEDWRQFYHEHETYKFVGFLKGRYYDSEGNPTNEMKLYKEKLKEIEKAKEAAETLEEKYPSCNSRWAQGEDSYVWCDEYGPKSNRKIDLWNVDDENRKVPRVFVYASNDGKQAKRCTCVSYLGSKDDNNLQVYKGCNPLSPRCKLLD